MFTNLLYKVYGTVNGDMILFISLFQKEGLCRIIEYIITFTIWSQKIFACTTLSNKNILPYHQTWMDEINSLDGLIVNFFLGYVLFAVSSFAFFKVIICCWMDAAYRQPIHKPCRRNLGYCHSFTGKNVT